MGGHRPPSPGPRVSAGTWFAYRDGHSGFGLTAIAIPPLMRSAHPLLTSQALVAIIGYWMTSSPRADKGVLQRSGFIQAEVCDVRHHLPAM